MQFIRSNVAQAVAAGMALGAVAMPALAADVQSRLQAKWQDEIAAVPVPASGCFKANYPSKVWTPVACTRAPLTPYVPRGITGASGGRTVGNGHDYAAVSSKRITTATGSFPSVTGLKSESDGGANIYSLQLNSDFFSTSVCNGSSNPASCQGWEQFVYSSSSGASFIQYWLINYGNTCPTSPYNDWNSYSGSCYRNSNAVNVPLQPILQLSHLSLRGTVTTTKDTFVTTTATSAYSTGGNDNVVKLATGWTANEFNVVGDGGGSAANFNTGTKITVRVAQKNGSTTAPACAANSGTTGETNNLNLGKCTATGGSNPQISFTESR